MWDARGCSASQILAGGLNAEQLETLAELAEEYSDGIAHVTTRQDFQLTLRFYIEDTPSVMRRLAAANITTREACRKLRPQRYRLPVFRCLARMKRFDVTRTHARRPNF